MDKSGILNASFGVFLLACDLLCLSSSSFCGQVSRIVTCVPMKHTELAKFNI